jgi:hypothetical protein
MSQLKAVIGYQTRHDVRQALRGQRFATKTRGVAGN